MTDFTQRAQALLQEKEQLIARLHQVDGALIELDHLATEDQTEDPTSDTES